MRIAVVLGGAAGNMGELATLRAMVNVDAVFAVNDAASAYPGFLDSFVTLHPEHLSRWLGSRNIAGFPEPREVIAHEAHPLVTRVLDYRWPGMNASGSSGLFAVKRALETHQHVVLCGVPMQASRAHYFNSQPWDEVHSFTDAWRIALPFIRDRVRSMSGWTADLLGKPTHEFLHPLTAGS